MQGATVWLGMAQENGDGRVLARLMEQTDGV